MGNFMMNTDLGLRMGNQTLPGMYHITTTCSDDIEKHYASHPITLTPLTINTKNDAQYVLDFKNMTQTNKHTSVQRKIRRVPKASPSNTATPEGTRKDRKGFRHRSVQFEWQFHDDQGSRITYGKPNSDEKVSHITKTCSDDIEKHYVRHPATQTPLTINSKNKAQYVLDVKNMTQTNQQTSVQRKIGRVPEASPSNTATPEGTRKDRLGFRQRSVQFECQFYEHGSWITYGKPNSVGNVSHITTTYSDDIEKHYVSNPVTLTPLTISSMNKAQYSLDFENMTQRKQQTSVQRKIRGVPKASPSNTATPEGTRKDMKGFRQRSVQFKWQFRDEHGSWITFGKPNTAGNVSHITTTCSDDIEKHYVSHPVTLTPLTISSMNKAQYVLDFKNMTQTNQKTSVQRKIRRVPKASPSNTTTPEGRTYVWSFKDEHGNWIKYGETSSSNEATSATTTTSDDIETKYGRNPTASLEIASTRHKYIIDFNAMTQTNIKTKAVRAIRRQLVTPSDLPSTWTPMNASDKGLRVVALNATDTEYINQVAFVRKTLPSSRTITKVFRIQNERLWRNYVSQKERLQKLYPQIKYEEVYLFHGTHPKHVQSICSENLDVRFLGTNGTSFGQGTYFAPSAAYSAKYAGSGPTKLMFIVKVLIGHYTVGNKSLRRPPKDASGVFYDATVNNQASPTIYVKYDKNEYYPVYYFEFT